MHNQLPVLVLKSMTGSCSKARPNFGLGVLAHDRKPDFHDQLSVEPLKRTLNLSNYYPLLCIEAVDKNPVKIQIRVLVSTDAHHNRRWPRPVETKFLKLVRFSVVVWITTKGNRHLISISRSKIGKLMLF